MMLRMTFSRRFETEIRHRIHLRVQLTINNLKDIGSAYKGVESNLLLCVSDEHLGGGVVAWDRAT